VCKNPPNCYPLSASPGLCLSQPDDSRTVSSVHECGPRASAWAVAMIRGFIQFETRNLGNFYTDFGPISNATLTSTLFCRSPHLRWTGRSPDNRKVSDRYDGRGRTQTILVGPVASACKHHADRNERWRIFWSTLIIQNAESGLDSIRSALLPTSSDSSFESDCLLTGHEQIWISSVGKDRRVVQNIRHRSFLSA